MGEVIFNQEMKRRLRAAVKGKRRAFLAERETSTEDVVMEDGLSSSDSAVAGPSSKMAELAKELESLLPSEEVDAIKASLGSLEMELAVDELLQRNAKALQRLEELQLQRLRAQGGGSSVVEIGSEEWDVGACICFMLTHHILKLYFSSTRHYRLIGTTGFPQATALQRRP